MIDDLQTLVEDKLPIKYVLGIEKEFETYPDAFDIVYNQVQKMIKNPARHTPAFTKHAIIKYDFADFSAENVESGLKKALELGLIEYTNETEGKEAYKIILNPFA